MGPEGSGEGGPGVAEFERERFDLGERNATCVTVRSFRKRKRSASHIRRDPVAVGDPAHQAAGIWSVPASKLHFDLDRM